MIGNRIVAGESVLLFQIEIYTGTRLAEAAKIKTKGKAFLMETNTTKVAILFPKIHCDARGSKRQACEIRYRAENRKMVVDLNSSFGLRRADGKFC